MNRSRIGGTCAVLGAGMDQWWLQTEVCRDYRETPENCWWCCSACTHHCTTNNAQLYHLSPEAMQC